MPIRKLFTFGFLIHFRQYHGLNLWIGEIKRLFHRDDGNIMAPCLETLVNIDGFNLVVKSVTRTAKNSKHSRHNDPFVWQSILFKAVCSGNHLSTINDRSATFMIITTAVIISFEKRKYFLSYPNK